MQALWITLGAIAGLILLIVLLLLVGKARVRIVCVQKPKIVASVFGIRFTLVSDEKKEKDATRDLSRCRNPKRALKKELRRQRKEAQKALKKQRKAKEKALRKAEKKKQKKAASSAPSPNVIENLEMITELLKKLYTVTQGKLRIRVQRMQISIATGDAAKTAFLYGVVLQSAAYLLQFIQTHFTEIERKPGAMEIRADYLAQKSHIDIDIDFSIRLISALRIGIRMLSAYQREKAIAQSKAKRRQKEKEAAKAV